MKKLLKSEICGSVTVHCEKVNICLFFIFYFSSFKEMGGGGGRGDTTNEQSNKKQFNIPKFEDD